MCSSSNFTSLESWPWPSALTFCETFPVKSWSGEMDVYRKPDEYLGGLGGMVSSKNAPILIDEFSCWATLSSNLLIIWCKGFPRLTFSSSPLSLKTRCTAASSRHFWRMEDFLLSGSGSLVVPELDIILRGARRRHLWHHPFYLYVQYPLLIFETFTIVVLKCISWYSPL